MLPRFVEALTCDRALRRLHRATQTLRSTSRGRQIEHGCGQPSFYLDPDEFRCEVAADVVALSKDDTNSNHFGLQLMYFRQWEELVTSARSPAAQRVVRAIAATFLCSENADDRTNALYLLHTLAIREFDPVSIRLLRRRLTVEPDWDVVRLFRPDEDEQAAWWPNRLWGVEASLLADSRSENRLAPPRNAMPFIDAEVRLALGDAGRYFRSDELPASYRVQVSAQWVAMLVKACDDARRSGLAPDSIETRLSLKTIDAELSWREMHEQLRQLFEEPVLPPELLSESISHAAVAAEQLVGVSEQFWGCPLSSFARYFVDNLLPPLGLFILMLDAQAAAQTAQRAIAVLARSGSPEQEILAYEAFVAECLQWRWEQGPGLSHGVPLALDAVGRRFKIVGAQFRKAWDHF
jgi:hypothetical protein